MGVKGQVCKEKTVHEHRLLFEKKSIDCVLVFLLNPDAVSLEEFFKFSHFEKSFPKLFGVGFMKHKLTNVNKIDKIVMAREYHDGKYKIIPPLSKEEIKISRRLKLFEEL